MPRKKVSAANNEDLTSRQKKLIFALVEGYCRFGRGMSSEDLKTRYSFGISSATIRNELAKLRELGYLYQPFVNASSQPTEKAFKLFINQIICGLQATVEQQRRMKEEIARLQQEQEDLQKQISRLLSLQSGAVGFSLNEKYENFSGVKNLLSFRKEDLETDNILDFLDNLDKHKKYLLEENNLLETQNRKGKNEQFKTIFGNENPVVPLGRGYALVAAEIYLDESKQEKAVVGLVAPVHLLAKKQNLQVIKALTDVFNKNSDFTEDK